MGTENVGLKKELALMERLAQQRTEQAAEHLHRHYDDALAELHKARRGNLDTFRFGREALVGYLVAQYADTMTSPLYLSLFGSPQSSGAGAEPDPQVRTMLLSAYTLLLDENLDRPTFADTPDSGIIVSTGSGPDEAATFMRTWETSFAFVQNETAAIRQDIEALLQRAGPHGDNETFPLSDELKAIGTRIVQLLKSVDQITGILAEQPLDPQSWIRFSMKSQIMALRNFLGTLSVIPYFLVSSGLYTSDLTRAVMGTADMVRPTAFLHEAFGVETSANRWFRLDAALPAAPERLPKNSVGLLRMLTRIVEEAALASERRNERGNLRVRVHDDQESARARIVVENLDPTTRPFEAFTVEAPCREALKDAAAELGDGADISFTRTVEDGEFLPWPSAISIVYPVAAMPAAMMPMRV